MAGLEGKNGTTGEVVSIRINKTYVQLLASIAAGVFTLCAVTIGFAIRMESRVTRVEVLIQKSLEEHERTREAILKLAGRTDAGFAQAGAERQQLRDQLAAEEMRRLKGDKGEE